MGITSPRSCVCATHGHCFDGLASAALLTEALVAQQLCSSFRYFACGYSENQEAPPFDGDENALLDYRYFPSDGLTYYFDHHPTAFVSGEDEAHFRRQQAKNPKRFVFAPEVGSCTQLIATHLSAHFGVDFSRLSDVIYWAHKIDTAAFHSVDEATDQSIPELRLANVVAQFADSSFLTQAIPILRTEGLRALCEAKLVRDHYRTLAPHYRKYDERIRQLGRLSGRVVRVDLIDEPVRVITKFAQYREFPEATYSVVLAKRSKSFVLSVGHNPWAKDPCDVHIGNICARFGGGGHPFVGGISVAQGEVTRALQIADEVVRELLHPQDSGPLR